ncbi:carboxypeptidase-like regulatory domain-containing protein [Metabacillus fastidiosus]|uniref:carboxypeptidase-like regulatory domain-containing protein n=1 Tax=Metabacillus fastidiosus TaxID=1458 RepID=UPI002DB630FB|nr:carboxypeptidase-like regulatory domain-containing protein [Metabacillus fastidiosus]MEC2077992.1 carboxypeptidase-like regulatory domain-containing protein [Metabacillus fastidiosus]
MAITDRYKLQPSPLITIDGHESEASNLQLTIAPVTDAGNISGIVRKADGTPLNTATVKLFTSGGTPFEHTNSNAAGRFIFPRVPVGSYFITASEPTYLTPLRIPVTVLRDRDTDVVITMQQDPDANKNAVFGIIQNSVNNQPIDDATVELFRVNGTTNELAGIVSSNAEGQYLFANLDNGTYFATAIKPGFLSSQGTPFTVTDRDFASSNLILAEDPDANTGTISGIVTDNQSNQPIVNAIVALYSVSNGVEMIIDISKTNAGGLYLFGDLPSGTYRVKATVQVET